MLLVQLASVILFPCNAWKKWFPINVYRYPKVLFNCHVLAFFETRDLKTVLYLKFVFYFLFPELQCNANTNVSK